jgi:hypothetical protein
MINARYLIGGVLLVCAVFIFRSAVVPILRQTRSRPGFFPVWLSGLLVLLSILYIIDSIRSEKVALKDILPQGKELKKVLALLGGMILFIVMVPYTGFLTASIVLLLILFSLDYKWYSGILISGAVGITACYVFKNFLSVPLPPGPFGF